MPFNLYFPYPIFYIIMLYNKEAVSRTFCSLSAGATATYTDTALYNFVNWFLIQLLIFIIGFLGKISEKFLIIAKIFILKMDRTQVAIKVF